MYIIDSSDIKSLISRARSVQRKRFHSVGVDKLVNSEMSSKECENLIELSNEAKGFIKKVFNKSALSTRGYYRLLKTGRTIADMEGSEKVGAPHIAEAFQLRIRES